MRPCSSLAHSLPQLVLTLKSLLPLHHVTADSLCIPKVANPPPDHQTSGKSKHHAHARPADTNAGATYKPFKPPSADRHQEPGAFGPTVSATWQKKGHHVEQVAAFAAQSRTWPVLPRLAKDRLLTLYIRCRFLTVDAIPKTTSSHSLFPATARRLTNGRVSGCVKFRNEPRP